MFSFNNMVPTRIKFKYEDGREALWFDVFTANPQDNLIFSAALQQLVAPYKFAIQAGRMTEERLTEQLAAAYGEGIIAASSLGDLAPREYAKWLVDHPTEFEQLRIALEPQPDEVTIGEPGSAVPQVR